MVYCDTKQNHISLIEPRKIIFRRYAPVQAEEPKAPAESEYTIEELADGAGNIFKVQRECVVAALKVAGVTTCTVSKAKELVDAFMKKEVK